MKVIETEDKYGKACMMFPPSTKVQDVHDWLNQHYQGYRFAIVLDETKDEYMELPEVCVNFLGDIADEAIEDGDGVRAVSDREIWRINQYLKDHGTSWEEVTRR